MSSYINIEFDSAFMSFFCNGNWLSVSEHFELLTLHYSCYMAVHAVTENWYIHHLV